MNNPYSVLGVREDASQEEIRAAYLKLVKKYHPDKYADSDLKELANDKLKEVNEAYDMLTKRNDAGRTAESARSYGGAYSGTGSSYSGPNSSDFSRARSYINQNNLQAAKQVLDAISIRNAEWYYLYGIIYLRQGWHAKASEYITMAYQQEPGNPEYSSAYQAIRNSGSTYYNRSAGSGNPYASDCSGCDVCTGLLCTDCCCECMGGDFIPCC